MKKWAKDGLMDREQIVMICAIALCALAAFLFSRPAGEKPAQNVPGSTVAPMPAPEGLRIAVASDLHFDPDNTDKSREHTEAVYNPELADALLWDAKKQGAEILLLTGDLVNGGKPGRHEALAGKLKQAEESGLTVLVLPGNHDLAPVTQTQFAAVYADFGYAEAYSRDAVSLSYCILREDLGLMILMMDTAGYRVSAIDLPGAQGIENDEAFFSEETLRWTERMLETAREKGMHVLCAGHFNLLPEINREHLSGYYLENAARFARLLREYGVSLYLSGHMHLRMVYREDGLTELLTEYLLAYPTGYSMLDLTDAGISCLPRRVDVDAWARETGQTDPVLLGFTAWQQEELLNYSRENVAYMTQRNPLKARETDQAVRFFYATMDAYWNGTLAERRAEIRAMPGYEPFFRGAEGYAYAWWLKDLIETAPPELAGFSLNW